jgi:hypothetical protein
MHADSARHHSIQNAFVPQCTIPSYGVCHAIAMAATLAP